MWRSMIGRPSQFLLTPCTPNRFDGLLVAIGSAAVGSSHPCPTLMGQHSSTELQVGYQLASFFFTGGAREPGAGWSHDRGHIRLSRLFPWRAAVPCRAGKR